jgi:AcrR family transcriptional regulator
LHDGVDGASLRRIATEAGTSIGMVYYYFSTKDELFLAVVEEVYQVVLADLLEALAPERPVEARIHGLYRRVATMTDEELLVIRLVLREALVSSSRLDQIIERFQRGHLPAMLTLLTDGLADGTFDTTIHPFVILLSMMALGGPAQLLRRRLGEQSPIPGVPDGAALSEQMLRILFHGVGSGTPGAGPAP